MSDQYPPYPGPPEPEDGDRATDPWGWLYRDDGPRSESGASDGTGETAREQPEAEATRVHDPYPTFVPSGGEPSSPEGLSVLAGSARPAVTALAPDRQQPERRRKGLLLFGIVVGALVLVVALALLMVYLANMAGSSSTGAPGASTSQQSSTGQQSSTSAPPSASQKPSSSQNPSSEQTYSGNVAPVQATGANADCVAADAKDGAGNTVSYQPGNVTDEDPATAWRCDGDAINQSITLQLPPGSKVARVGLINGYAKVDPKSNAERYPEYRRITKVRWTFPNGKTFDQNLSDGDQAVQNLNIPVQTNVDSVQLTILATTDPGTKESSRNAVLVSTIAIGQPT